MATSMIPYATFKDEWSAWRLSGSIIRIPMQVLVTITGMREHYADVTDWASTTLWLISSVGAVAYSQSANDAALHVFNHWFAIWTGFKCHSTSPNSTGKCDEHIFRQLTCPVEGCSRALEQLQSTLVCFGHLFESVAWSFPLTKSVVSSRS